MWAEEGEKNSHFFLSLEKRNWGKKTISQVKVDENTVLTENHKVMAEIERYFKNIYTSRANETKS